MFNLFLSQYNLFLTFYFHAVYIVNTGDHVYCWIGSGASVDERKNGIPYACNYLGKTETPWLPITVVAEGNETQDFKEAF